jgi:hypothetical protein
MLGASPQPVALDNTVSHVAKRNASQHSLPEHAGGPTEALFLGLLRGPSNDISANSDKISKIIKVLLD